MCSSDLVHYAGRTLDADLSAYANFVDDLIVSAPVSPTLYRMDNVSSAEIYGAEAAGQWQFASGWELFGNAAYVRGRDVGAGEPLRFIPPLNGLAGLRQTLENGFWWSGETVGGLAPRLRPKPRTKVVPMLPFLP